MKKLLTTAAYTFAALMVFAFAPTNAYAAPVIVGNSHPTLASAAVTSFNLSGNTFTFTINNTSPFNAGITGIGFDLPGAPRIGFSLVGSTDNDFNLSLNPGNVPQFNGANLDFALLTNNNFGGGGNPNRGILSGQSATFTVSGNFANLTANQIVNSIFVRFQQVGANGQLSDVGTVVPGAEPVPEPATMILLGSGLAGVAAKLRRRRKTDDDAAQGEAA